MKLVLSLDHNIATIVITDPRPRPATYDAGAGIDKNASLFGLLLAAMVLRLAEVAKMRLKDGRPSREASWQR